jgi:hypothetical protein
MILTHVKRKLWLMPGMLAVVHAVASQVTVAVQTPMAYIMNVDVDKQFQHKICTPLECSIQLNTLSSTPDTLSSTPPDLATCDHWNKISLKEK